MAPRVAWMGLGNLGRGMCKNLAEKGNLDQPLIIFNRTEQRAIDMANKLGSGKTEVASSIEDAVQKADIIFFCLGDDKSVISTVDIMLKSGKVTDKLFVDCSTVHPDTSNQLSSTIADAGGRFVACPVFGAAAMAEAGQLIFVMAGPAADVEKVIPYGKGVMGRENIALSDEEPGKATLLKVIGNTFILNMVEALAQGHTLAEKTGLGSENLHRYITAMFGGAYAAYSSRMKALDFAEDDFQPLFGVELAQKDARHALSLAESSGTKLRNVEIGAQHLAEVKNLAGDKGDLAGIYGAVRVESGLPYGPK